MINKSGNGAKSEEITISDLVKYKYINVKLKTAIGQGNYSYYSNIFDVDLLIKFLKHDNYNFINSSLSISSGYVDELGIIKIYLDSATTPTKMIFNATSTYQAYDEVIIQVYGIK